MTKIMRSVQIELAKRSLDKKWNDIYNMVNNWKEIDRYELLGYVGHECPYCHDAEKRRDVFDPNHRYSCCRFCIIHRYLCHARSSRDDSSLVDMIQESLGEWTPLSPTAFLLAKEGINLLCKAFEEIAKLGKMSKSLKKEVKDYIVKMREKLT